MTEFLKFQTNSELQTEIQNENSFETCLFPKLWPCFFFSTKPTFHVKLDKRRVKVSWCKSSPKSSTSCDLRFSCAELKAVRDAVSRMNSACIRGETTSTPLGEDRPYILERWQLHSPTSITLDEGGALKLYRARTVYTTAQAPRPRPDATSTTRVRRPQLEARSLEQPMLSALGR